MRSRSLEYMPALDGLRAIAVAMVFWIHAFPARTPFPGALGVDVFFVISGFLITRILLKEVSRTGTIDLRSFYLKRLIRLYPALLVMLGVVCLIWAVDDRGLPWEKLRGAAIAVMYMSNVYMTVTGDRVEPFAHTWSLGMEEQFYLAWPLALLAMVKLNWSKAWMIGICVVGMTASLTGWVLTGADMPYNPLTKSGGLLAGCILALVVARRPWQHTGLACGATVGFVASLAMGTAGVLGHDALQVIATLLLPFIITHLAFGSGPIVSLLSHRALVHLGVISYGLYLWHYPILFVLHRIGVDGLVGLFVGAVATLVVSEASFRFVERPALRLKDRIRAARGPSLPIRASGTSAH